MSVDLRSLAYRHVHVFARERLSGNGLTVFPDGGELPADLMQRLTQEMRQFESIFLSSEGGAPIYRAHLHEGRGARLRWASRPRRRVRAARAARA